MRHVHRNRLTARRQTRLVRRRSRLELGRRLGRARRNFDLLRQHYRLRIDEYLGEPRGNRRRNTLLISAAQMPGQEFLGFGEQCEVVDWPRETVAFVGRQHVFDGESAIAQRDDDLLALRPVHARIVGALHHQQRRLDLAR